MNSSKECALFAPKYDCARSKATRKGARQETKQKYHDMKTTTIRAFLALCLTLTAGQAWSWDKGRGTINDPYLIESKADWDKCTFEEDGYWLLATDLVGENAITTGNKALNGTESKTYVLDGGFHTIELDIHDSNNEYLFYAVLYSAIKNLKFIGQISGSGEYQSIIGLAHNVTLERITNETTFEATGDCQYFGGLIGNLWHSHTQNTLNECSYTGKINTNGYNVTDAAGLIGNVGANTTNTISNCFIDCNGWDKFVNGYDIYNKWEPTSGPVTIENTYYIPRRDAQYQGATCVTAEQAASGEVCFALNGSETNTRWRQKLGKDAHPYMDINRPIVFKIKDGVYVNSPEGRGTSDDPYLICGDKDWLAFSYIQKNHWGISNHWKIENDITIKIDSLNPEMIVPTFKDGTLDGCGHTLTLDIDSLRQEETKGLFGTIEGSTIKDLNLTGHVYARGDGAGGLAKEAMGVTMQNVRSNVVVELREGHTGSTWGGFFGYIHKDSNKGYELTSFTHCSYTGRLLGDASFCGGFAGYAHQGVPVTIKHCFVDITGSTVGQSRDILRNNENFKHVVMENTYYVPNHAAEQPGATKASAEDFASGRVCYLLNDSLPHHYYSQEIGKDKYPQYRLGANTIWKQGDTYYNRSFVELEDGFNTTYDVSDETQIYSVHEFLPTMENFLYSNDYAFSYGLEKGLTDEGAEKSFFGRANKFTDLFEEFSHTPYEVYLDTKVCTRTSPCNAVAEAKRQVLPGGGEIESHPLYLCAHAKYYDLIVMERGKQLHHFIPARRGAVGGFYDAVADTFLTVDGKVFINEAMCQHPYTEVLRHDGLEETHCKVCDKLFDTKYYAVVRFDDNLKQRPSKNTDYNKVYGAMMDQTIEGADTLKTNLLRRPMHIFDSWNTKADGSGTAFKDNKEFTATEALHDSLKLYAQWTPAYCLQKGVLQGIPSSGVVKRLELVDNAEDGFAAAADFRADSLFYTMTPKVGHHWGTICLPFEIEAQEGLTLYTEGRVTNDTILVGNPAEIVPAGTPAIFHITDAKGATGEPITLKTSGKAVSENVKELVTADGLHLSGVLDYQNVKCDTAVNTYYGIMYDKFYRVNTTITLNPYRAYFYVPRTTDTYQAYKIMLRDDVTSIQALPEEKKGTEIYDLSGRRLAAPRKGVNIINGKKVIR